MRSFHIHLVSDATGDTLKQVARAAIVQFDGVDAIEHPWTMVRSESHLRQVISGIKGCPGLVLCTFVNRERRDVLQAVCHDMGVPCLFVLDPILSALGSYFGIESRQEPGRQHAMDAAYEERIEAMNYCLAHDDGQLLADLERADVVLVGVSRTSKTPTCIYLANRGIKAANVPLVPGVPFPAELEALDGPLVVGLTTSPDRLTHIRHSRLLALKQGTETDYVDLESVKQEIAAARRYYERHGWPVIDVTRRSIEETSAAVLQLLAQRGESIPS
ncbi:MAG: kinase/pyrophosphorylase [Alphaproteobacteria bacterium]|nr:kinase/pyrophosphorylase [Alphaproteobacteria bacterium]